MPHSTYQGSSTISLDLPRTYPARLQECTGLNHTLKLFIIPSRKKHWPSILRARQHTQIFRRRPRARNGINCRGYRNRCRGEIDFNFTMETPF